MKFKFLLLILTLIFVNCQNNSKGSDTAIPVEIEDSLYMPAEETKTLSIEKPTLTITSNALQLVDRTTGSTKELPTGMEMSKIVGIVNSVFGSKMPEPQINSECGAGPMTLMVWKNGLILMFQKSRTANNMEFVGWSLSQARGDRENTIKTMAGIGIGSTRAELEKTYSVEINKTSLGQEFSTNSGLYGVLNGPLKNDKIEFMWSGLSCNFR